MTTKTEIPVALVYTPALKAGSSGRLHRETCNHIPKSATPIPAASASVDDLLAASRATCCSVREFDRRNAVNAAKSADMAPKPKATKKAAQTAARAAKIGTFTAESKDVTHKCVGACGQKLSASKFPTVTGTPGLRVAECRTCRNERTAATKAAKVG